MLSSYLRVLQRSLTLIPLALQINSASTREFSCKVVIIASFRFPKYRRALLTRLTSLVPALYHIDPSLVDIVEFHPPKNSVCIKYEDLMPAPESMEECYTPFETTDSIPFSESQNRLRRLSLPPSS